MSRSAALARRLLSKALAVGGGGAAGASASCCSAAPAAAAAALRAPAASAASSWTLVSRARALSSSAAPASSSSSSVSIPSLTALMRSSSPPPPPPSSAASSPSPPRRAVSSSASPRAAASTGTEDDDDDDDAGDDEYFAGGVIYPSPQAAVGKRAPDFNAPAVVGGEVRPLSLRDYRGRYVALLWYPKDFTYVCPTEIIAFSDRAKEFEELNCQVIAASTDSEECHLAWIKTPRHRGGLGYMQVPIVADVTKEIAARYGVLLKSAGIALRGLFIINPEGVIQHITINDLPIGRSVDEALRTLQAIRFHAEHGEVCPAGWKPGDRGMHADERAQDYFGNVYKEGTAAAGEDGLAPGLEAVKSRREWDTLLSGGKPFVLYVGAPWCGKCRMLGPFVSELADKHPELTFVKLDSSAEAVEPIAQELGVKALPATHFYGSDGKPALPPITGYKRRPLEEAVEKMAAEFAK